MSLTPTGMGGQLDALIEAPFPVGTMVSGQDKLPLILKLRRASYRWVT